MTDEQLTQFEIRVQQLNDWKNSREKERLTYPLDFSSRKTIISNPTLGFQELPIFTQKTYANFDTLLTDFIGIGIEITVNDKKRVMLSTPNLFPFTANAGTDTITSTSGAHNLNNNTIIVMTSTVSLPAGLNTITEYYVINRTDTTFQVSLTLGGSAVDITGSGTGTHYYTKP